MSGLGLCAFVWAMAKRVNRQRSVSFMCGSLRIYHRWEDGRVDECDGLHLSDAEFDAVMTEIDAELRRESDRIVGRGLRGCAKFSQRFRMSLIFGEPFADRIIDWFKAMYGDRLNVDMDFGKSFVVIR